MTKSQMLPAVLQAVTLYALGTIVSHHLMNNVFEFATNSELFSNYTKAIGMDDVVSRNSTAEQMAALNGTTHFINNTTWTITNITQTANGTTHSNDNAPKSFYFYTFPRNLFVTIVLVICHYYWHIWLERTFPGRLRPNDLPPPSEKGDGEGDESREEAVVQKWIAQGKVKRASLNWWNTLVKWVVHLTIGTLWAQTLGYLLHDVLLAWSMKAFAKDKRYWIKWEILIRCALSFLNIETVTSLISFIIIPAHKRIVFIAGADLIWEACFGLLLGRIVAWLESNEFVQVALKNMTAQANSQKAKPVALNETRLVDEL